jgi:hypothetical protein
MAGALPGNPRRRGAGHDERPTRASDRPDGGSGDAFDPAIIRIRPRRVISFGIDDKDTEPHKLVADIRNV